MIDKRLGNKKIKKLLEMQLDWDFSIARASKFNFVQNPLTRLIHLRLKIKTEADINIQAIL